MQAIVEYAAAASAGLAYTDAAGAYRITRLHPGLFRLRAQTGNRIGEGDRGFVLGVGQTVVAPTGCPAATVWKGPSGESPARISAVKPGVSVVTASCEGVLSSPASSTSPTPGFANAW